MNYLVVCKIYYMHIPYTIVFASDDSYSQHLCVAIYSLVKNFSDNKNLHIIVLDWWISDTNKSKIQLSCKKYNDKITFVATDASIFKPYIAPWYNEFTYTRLLTHTILPDIDQVLYLDSDIVVTGDLLPLCQTSLSNYYVAACPTERALSSTEKEKSAPHIQGSDPFFWAGVMLMNLKKIREEKYLEKFVEYLKINKEHILFCDQDVLNHFFNHNRLPLDPWYNVTNSLLYSVYHQETRYSHDVYQKIKHNPFIIHFAWWSKPWDGDCFHIGNTLYWSYLSETAYQWYIIPSHKLYRWQRYKFMIAYYIQKLVSRLPYPIYNIIVTIRRKFLLPV